MCFRGWCKNIAFLSVASAVLLLTGCKQEASSTPGATPTAAEAAISDMKPISAYQVGDPLTDEECQAWVDQFIAGMQTPGSEEVTKLIDWKSLMDRSTSGVDATEEMRSAFMKGALNSISDSTLGGIKGPILEGAHYRMLRIREVDGQRQVVMRLLPTAGGSAYHDFMLVRQADGQTRAVDMYIYLTGESMSELMRRMYLQFALEQNKSFLKRLSGSENLMVKHIQDLAKITELVRSQRGAEALQLCEKLPAELHRDKSVMVLRFMAAQAAGEAEYAAVLEDLEKIAPTDGTMDLMMIDAYYMKQDFKRALRCVNRFDKLIGGDPYLEALRANLYVGNGEPDKARQAIDRAIQQEPELLSAYWTLVTLQLQDQDFDGVLESLNLIASKFVVEFADLTQIPEYAEFIKSPQYQTWVESRAQPPAE